MLKLIMFLSFFSTKDCREDYLNKILESKSYNRYYIFVKVKINNNESEIGVLNYNFYRLLKSRSSKFSDISYYRDFIKGKMSKKEAINLTKADIKKIDAGFIKIDSSVIALASKSKLEFVKHFFYVSEKYNYATLKHDVASEKIGTIMKILFDWNYLLAMVEGKLTIEEIDFCSGRNH